MRVRKFRRVDRGGDDNIIAVEDSLDAGGEDKIVREGNTMKEFPRRERSSEAWRELGTSACQ